VRISCLPSALQLCFPASDIRSLPFPWFWSSRHSLYLSVEPPVAPPDSSRVQTSRDTRQLASRNWSDSGETTPSTLVRCARCCTMLLPEQVLPPMS
jgi:hypothetical protein